jgi:hypothetical protein
MNKLRPPKFTKAEIRVIALLLACLGIYLACYGFVMILIAR